MVCVHIVEPQITVYTFITNRETMVTAHVIRNEAAVMIKYKVFADGGESDLGGCGGGAIYM
jgi:hypothetical protein